MERLVEECMPELLDFFESRSLPHREIDRIFFDALYRLAHQWETIQDHRAWLLETLDAFAREELTEEPPGSEDESGGSASPESTPPGDPEDPDPRSSEGDDS